MPQEKILPDDRIDEFKRDWVSVSLPGLAKKYTVSVNHIKKWARALGCPLPKPQAYQSPQKIELIPSGNGSGDTRKYDYRSFPEVKTLVDELEKTANSDMTPKEKYNTMVTITNKILVKYITMATTLPELAGNVVDFRKLQLYEKKVAQYDKEPEELNEATLKSLKRQFIQEALTDIAAELTPGEKRFFDTLIQLATDRVLARRKQQEEVQMNQLASNGVVVDAEDAEVVH
jgi:hypothetical protein